MEEQQAPFKTFPSKGIEPRATGWLRSTAVPVEHRKHGLIFNRVFFTLPEDLLKRLVDELALAGELASGMEIELSRICGDHTQTVGFCDTAPIGYPYLRRRAATSVALDEAARKLLSKQIRGDVLAKLQTAERRLRRHFDIAKAYAGWLLSHRPYFEEQDSLLREYHQEIAKWGLPNLGRPIASKFPSDVPVSLAPDLHVFVDRFEAFYLRWRLSGLAAPNLPLPIPPQTPVPVPILATGALNEVGTLFYLPDTYPVPSRDELRAMLEDSLREAPETAEHLAGWTKLIRRDNPAKNRLVRFARILEIQHYCRILEERHSEQIKRRQGRLERALGRYLKVSDATIHSDLLVIRKRLGEGWMRRGNNVTMPA